MNTSFESNINNSGSVELDPSELQRVASNPHESVWVGASAGTGKTKVLTERVLRLLLPRDDGTKGTLAHRVLCLTFTKAAASEMSIRISKILSRWAVMPIDSSDNKTSLRSELSILLGREPSDKQLASAQSLFAEVIDSPEGLKIMTIHSFCQSILGRFPLEAGISPHFTLLEDMQVRLLIQQALQEVLEFTRNESDYARSLRSALDTLSGIVPEDRFLNMILEVCKERAQFETLLRQFGSITAIHNKICELYSIDPHLNHSEIVRRLCNPFNFDQTKLRYAGRALCEGSLKEAELGNILLAWLELSIDERIERFGAICSVFLVEENTKPRKQSFPSKPTQKKYSDIEPILKSFSEFLLDGMEEIKKVKSASCTYNLLLLGNEVIRNYAKLKEQRSALDFDDLILKTYDLLKGQTFSLKTSLSQNAPNITPWIMFKLDQGLDHILVDEAQDTNPEQWRIIEALSDDFFSGKGAREDLERTLFVVGDVKQSIYSFQRAAPEEFHSMQQLTDQKIRAAGQTSRILPLDMSFRSTETVLDVVDSVFTDSRLLRALGVERVSHKSYRTGQGGLVELWPLEESDPQEDKDFWEPPLKLRETKSGSSKLATRIARTIRCWIDEKELLPSYNRPISPGDIMILVQTRTNFVDQLVRALKLLDIPVSGVDRMILGEQLAVQDLLAVAQFCLTPHDDLNLACLLKSPFIGFSESDLFSLAFDRKDKLWLELVNYTTEGRQKLVDEEAVLDIFVAKNVHSYLSQLIHDSQHLGPYEFFQSVLQRPCPADKRSGLHAIRSRLGEDAMDPIEEFMNFALNFANDQVDDLQVFIATFERSEIEIKRELEEHGQHVRIMTVHGSKGLQAPIVILPDTTKKNSSRKLSRLLWPIRLAGLSCPIWSVRKKDDPQIYANIFANAVAQQEDENARLLYVAMTRAADRLYIGGYKGKRGASATDNDTWYGAILAGMQRLDNVAKTSEGGLIIKNNQIADPDKIALISYSGVSLTQLPEWIFNMAPQEPSPPRNLVPSRTFEDENNLLAALSPLQAKVRNRFSRGILTHKLMQFLPEVALEKRLFVAKQYVERYGTMLSSSIQEEILTEVMAILQNEEFSSFFQKGSLAEVPITGVINGRVISGQIDRLLIENDQIWILDYKTNRPPPMDIQDIPLVYRNQIDAYRRVILSIYPKHKVHCALLWTDGPFMTIL